jgi:hypothetical protein
MNNPTVEEVDRIAAIGDPVIRNLNITQCYYELSAAFAQLTGNSPNWCTYATWASKQAGQTIRKEDPLRTFELSFRHSGEILSLLEILASYLKDEKRFKNTLSIGESVRKVLQPETAFERSAEAVARGNKKVFEEIGREFARLITIFRNESDVTEDTLAVLYASLRPGDPPDGQQYLRDAFKGYWDARIIQDDKVRAELIFYANLLIGFHEQTRLQPEIVEALNAPVGDLDTFRKPLQQMLLPGLWIRIRHYIIGLLGQRLPFDKLIDRLIDTTYRLVRETITHSLMTIHIPVHQVLRLGKDLGSDFPLPLRQLTYELLIELLIRIDPTPDSGSRSGAKDWGDFNDRIHFIADFFRSYHGHAPLLEAPFSPEQTKILKAGKIPEGRL